MKRIRRTLVTNICLVLIIMLVYVASFGFITPAQSLALKGCTGADNVGLQIMVDENSDVDAYMDRLDEMGVSVTFFFCEQCCKNSSEAIGAVLERGHGVGYYVCGKHEGKQTDMYIGNGYSVPVMSCDDDGDVRHIGPSIDFTRLKTLDDWQHVLAESIFADMFIRIHADNQFEEFEKVVQIVRDKGYTILKVEEML